MSEKQIRPHDPVQPKSAGQLNLGGTVMNAYRYTELVNEPMRRLEERLDIAQTAAKASVLIPLGLLLLPVILFLQAFVVGVDCLRVVIEVLGAERDGH